MEIPKYALKGLGYGAWRGFIRPTYHTLRALHWIDTDRRDPEGADARNAETGERARMRREWGGWWTGERWGLPPLPPLPALTVEQKIAERWQNNDLLLMSELSPAELRAYNRMFFQRTCMLPALETMQMIENMGPGPNNPYPHLYDELTGVGSGTNHAINFLQDLFKDAGYRKLREQQFLEKLRYEEKVAKSVEKANMKTFIVNTWYKILHELNDDTMKDILQRIMKILLLVGGDKDK